MSFDTSIFKTLSRNERPRENDFEAALTAILKGQSNDSQVSALLLGLEMIGLTSQEVRVGTKVMRQHMTPVHIDADVIDIVGTGGTGLHTLSISTAAAIVCAGAGAKVAKHGNRAASSLTGTADTLSELGVNLAISPEKAAECVLQAGIGFLFAPNHHPAMRHVGPARKALAMRTLFNMLGPLSNPAGAKRQLLGVCDDTWRRPMADALNDLGSTHVWVVHGAGGLDEISTLGPTRISEVKDGQVHDFTISPEDYEIPLTVIDDLRGGKPADNAKALTSLLQGRTSPYRDIVLLNAGASLMLAGLVTDIPAGIDLATQAIDDGRAANALARLIEVSTSTGS